MKKRILSLFIVFSMVTSFFPQKPTAVSPDSTVSSAPSTASDKYTVKTILEPSMRFDDVYFSYNSIPVVLAWSGDGWDLSLHNAKNGELLFDFSELDNYWYFDDARNNEEGFLGCIEKNDGGQYWLFTNGDESWVVSVDLQMIYDDNRDYPLGFRNGLTPVRKGNTWVEFEEYYEDGYWLDYKYGVANSTGELVVPFIYDYVGEYGYNDGLLQVQIGENWITDIYNGHDYGYYDSYKYGVIDTSGEIVVPIIYDYMFEFQDGIAAVAIGNDWSDYKWGFVDTSGKIIIPIEYDNIYFGAYSAVINNDVLAVEKDGKYGVIDLNNQVIIPFEYERLTWDYIKEYDDEHFISFQNGKLNGVLNKNNEIVFSIEVDSGVSFYNDDYAIVRKDGKYGVINRSYELIVPFEYDSIYSFSGDLAMVRKGDKYGFINKSGEVVVPLIYDSASPYFYGGHTSVRLNGKYGFINNKGDLVVPTIYTETRSFNEGLAAVSINGLWGFVDEDGEIAIPVTYYSVNSFSGGVAQVYVKSGTNISSHYIDKNGNTTTRNYDYKDSLSYYDDCDLYYSAIFNSSGYDCGIIDVNDNVIVPAVYKNIMYAGREDETYYIWVCENDLWGIISVTANPPTQTKVLPNFIAPIEIIDPTAPQYADWIPVSDRAGLKAIADNLDGNFYLTNDIDLDGEEWVPINNGEDEHNPFTGILDGQGYIIRNMAITKPYVYAGLFGYTDNATIKNVGLEGTNIKINNNRYVNAGGIVGYTHNSITISNCYNTGDIEVDSGYDVGAGGIVGEIWGNVNITDCYNTGNITGSSSDNTDAWTIVGGIVGDGYYSCGTISNCFNTGNITALEKDARAGGIAGLAMDINKCYNTGNINSDCCAGGICNDGEISDCYNAGNVTSLFVSGGIISYNENTRNCYNTGDLEVIENENDSFIGGISGYSHNGIINNCYWNSDSKQVLGGVHQNPKMGIGSQPDYSGDVDTTTPLTTAQMQQQSSFVGFDFDNVWTYIDGVNNNMPVLQAFEKMYKPTQTQQYPTPDGYSDNDYQKLVKFLIQGDNPMKLNFDLSDPDSWEGYSDMTYFVWNDDSPRSIKHIKIKDMVGGKLDLSDFVALESIYIDVTFINDVDVTNTPSFRSFDLCYSELTDLSTLESSESIKNVYVQNNYLDLSDPVIIASIAKIQAIVDKNGGEFIYTPQRTPQLYPTPDGYSDNDYQKLVAFALQGDNLAKLGWDLTDPESWGGVIWWEYELPKKAYHVSLASGLSGNADFSEFTRLGYLYIEDSSLTNIDVSGCELLVRVDLGNNNLTDISSFENVNSLLYLNVKYNLLDLDSPDIQASIAKIQAIIDENDHDEGGFYYTPQNTPPPVTTTPSTSDTTPLTTDTTPPTTDTTPLTTDTTSPTTDTTPLTTDTTPLTTDTTPPKTDTTPLTSDTTPLETTTAVPGHRKGIISTEGIAAGEPTIFCFIEILLYLVGLESMATDNPDAVLSAEGKREDEPTIFCGIEILQYLVGITDGSEW